MVQDNLYLAVQKQRFVLKNMNVLDVAILLYLSTFMDYSGEVHFFNTKTPENIQAKSYLKVSYDTLKSWEQLMIKKHIITVQNGMYVINRGMFFLEKNMNSAKKYINSDDQYILPINRSLIRELYYDFILNGSWKMRVWVKIHLYIHSKYGMLCKNPYEDDVEKLELITLEDMAKLLGYSNRESKEYEVLLEILYKIIFWRSHDINLNDSFMFIYPECILPGEMRIKYEKYASSGSDAAYKWIRKYADVSGIEQFVKQPIIINSDVYGCEMQDICDKSIYT